MLSQILQVKVGTSAPTDYLYGLDRLTPLSGSTKTWYLGDALGSVRRTLGDSGLPRATASALNACNTTHRHTMPSSGRTSCRDLEWPAWHNSHLLRPDGDDALSRGEVRCLG